MSSESFYLCVEPQASPGRYACLRKLGRGGMGEVFEAIDMVLGRPVALKKIPSTGDHQRNLEISQRLRAEAQKLARLSHPNVVQVYDVFLDESGKVRIAMELINGEDLHSWAIKNPDWKECLRVFLHAGRGLKAIHEADLVHRDFKPGNVMVGDDEQVKVIDLGLALTSQESLDDDSSFKFDDGSEIKIIGTVQYMSPEQLMGIEADAKSDQFSFCVSLYEALYGQRPFGDCKSRLQLFDRIKKQEFVKLERKVCVPRGLERIIKRGLSANPSDRWPSMEILLEELEKVPIPLHRRKIGLALAVVSGSVLSLPISHFVSAQPNCRLQGLEMMDDTWNSNARRKIDNALSNANNANEDPKKPLSTVDLDASAYRWMQAYGEACEITDSKIKKRVLACLKAQAESFKNSLDADSASSLSIYLPDLNQCSEYMEPIIKTAAK